MFTIDSIKKLTDDDLYKIAELYDSNDVEAVEKLLNTKLPISDWETLSDELANEINLRQEKEVEKLANKETDSNVDLSLPSSWFWFAYSEKELQEFDKLKYNDFLKKFEITTEEEYIAAKTSLKLAIEEYKNEEIE